MQKMINELALLKEFALLCIVCMLAFFLYVQFHKKHVSFHESNTGLLGIFVGLHGTPFYLLVAVSLNILFLLSMLFRFQPMRLVHVWTFVILTLLCFAFCRAYKMFGYLAINQVLAGCALVIVNMLVTYVQEVHFEWTFFFVYLAAAIFLCLYFLYMYLTLIRMIMKGKLEYEKTRKTKQRKGKQSDKSEQKQSEGKSKRSKGKKKNKKNTTE